MEVSVRRIQVLESASMISIIRIGNSSRIPKELRSSDHRDISVNDF